MTQLFSSFFFTLLTLPGFFARLAVKMLDDLQNVMALWNHGLIGTFIGVLNSDNQYLISLGLSGNDIGPQIYVEHHYLHINHKTERHVISNSDILVSF